MCMVFFIGLGCLYDKGIEGDGYRVEDLLSFVYYLFLWFSVC